MPDEPNSDPTSAPSPAAEQTTAHETLEQAFLRQNAEIEARNEKHLERLAAVLKPAATPPAEVDPWAGVDPETLSGSKLTAYIAHYSAKEAKAEARALFEKETAPLRMQVEQMSAEMSRKQVAEFNAELATVKASHKDFDTFVPAIKALAAENRGLTLEELYDLAKKRANKGQPRPAAITDPRRSNPSSERPTHSAARPSQAVTREKPLPRGGLGIRQLLQERDARLANK